jgi:hypothetical protein
MHDFGNESEGVDHMSETVCGLDDAFRFHGIQPVKVRKMIYGMEYPVVLTISLS